jgi:hypothetical protein
MSETLPLPLTPSERMALEAVEQGCLVTPALERLRKNGWIASGKAGLWVTDAGRQALLDDLSARMGHRSARTGGRRDRTGCLS